MRKILGGLAAGVCAWWYLRFLLSSYTNLYCYLREFHWLPDSIPVFVGGCVTGYIVARRGLIWGSTVAVLRQLYFSGVLFWRFAWSARRLGLSAATGYLKEISLILFILESTAIIILVGAAGGYLGQRLALIRLRRTDRLRLAEEDKPKTYRPSKGLRRSEYLPFASLGLIWIIGLYMAVRFDWHPEGIRFMQLHLVMTVVFAYIFISKLRTRISFCQDHLRYYGAEVLPFNYRIPWNTMQEIVVSTTPRRKASIYYRDARNSYRHVEIPLFLFSDVSDMVHQLKEIAKKHGIPLREA